ncbi:hypothetical protein [Mesorhizobium sp. RIZ17]|uniref:hypothetical protein n=1 Tax=Mesorhizobium sp. RIZ17 TaxID=3132743 RepID=UPI003DA97A10
MAKVQYLLEIEARGQLDLPEHIQALLGSMIPKPRDTPPDSFGIISSLPERLVVGLNWCAARCLAAAAGLFA